MIPFLYFRVIDQKTTGENNMKKNFAVFTRTPNKYYDKSLANSIHFAYLDDNDMFEPLNQNYGILFAEATINENNTIAPKSIKNPVILKMDDQKYTIIATRISDSGEEDSPGFVLMWTTSDFKEFENMGLIPLQDELLSVLEETKKDTFKLNFSNEEVKVGNAIELEENTLNEVINYWTPIHHVETNVDENVTVSSKTELENLKAIAMYSDGSIARKQVDWDLDAIDFATPGTYQVKGKAKTLKFQFPLARGYADPVILPWEGKYYFIATNDNVNDIGLFVRESDTIEGLFAPGYVEVLILDVDEEKDFIQTFWAPEFHVIGEELYILFAVGGKQWAPQCHSMKLKKGGKIDNPDDWETPIRFKKKDGSFLTTDGISLDMTYFKAKEKSYMVWSYRFNIGTPNDSGSMIYIGEIDEKDPTILISDPVLLTRPLFGWENLRGTINNEGPYPIITEDTIYIVYAAADARGYLYSLGTLSIPIDGDCLDSTQWKKSPTPLLHFQSFENYYGAGHNSFFTDYEGNVWIMYHAVEGLDERIACSAMNRVHFRANRTPVFNMSAERDLNPQLANVMTTVTITGN